MIQSNIIITHLKSLLGDEAVHIPTPDQITDRRGLVSAPAVAIVYPSSTQQVSKVLRFCHDNTIGIVPQGGNTGNCAGAVPNPDVKIPCVLMNLQRMNTIKNIDPKNNTITVQAGCILADIQRACTAHGRSFPVTLAPADRVQAGGLLATNAGGLNVIHYGMTKHNVLGLEYVLPNGDIVTHLNTLTKNALGIDIDSIMIGAEGTLGIITHAVMKLHPPITHRHTGLIQFDTIDQGIEILRNLQSNKTQIYAFEVWNANTHMYAQNYAPNAVFKTLPPSPWYGLVDILNENPPNHPAIPWLLENHAQTAWDLRKNFSYALAEQGHIAHDIAVPLTQWQPFLEAVDTAVHMAITNQGAIPPIPAHFGHLGDGNLHVEYLRPHDLPRVDFRALTPIINQAVYDTVKRHQGTPASEHGVGQTKRHLIQSHLCPNAYGVMKHIKQTFDPKGIMNPGKIFHGSP